ncbi:hypothetical protein ACN20G_18405 [Streptomyces sp. BI20]|uniref:hypothetical protein n=1 Tax=Streptomyces sp. BI20 TaxID=3403460 RepID=UPI003C749C6A
MTEQAAHPPAAPPLPDTSLFEGAAEILARVTRQLDVQLRALRPPDPREPEPAPPAP